MSELIDLLSGLPVGGISFGALVSLAIILIFRGDIVPRSTVEAMRADRDAIIEAARAENAMLKEAYRMSEEARKIGAENDKELLVLGQTTVRILESIHKKANEVRT